MFSLRTNNNEVPKFNSLMAYLSGVTGMLLCSLFLFYFEFRDGDIKVAISALSGVVIFAVFYLIKGRVTGFKELIFMILGIFSVLVVYEIFIDMLYMYEAGMDTTLGNLVVYAGTLSVKLKIVFNNLLRSMPAILVLIVFAMIFVDPIINEND